MSIRKLIVLIGAAGMFLVTGVAPVQAADKLKPYVLASNAAADPAQVIQQTRAALEGQGLEIAGEYSPYEGAHIMVVTSEALRAAAAKSEKGGFGAVQRVSVTEHGGKVQVAYTNPVYMASAYRMAEDLAGVAKRLEAALGPGEPFGAEGLTAKKLRKYHYMVFRPYFDDTLELGEFSSYEEAVKAVEEGLAGKYGGVSKVSRVDIPGKQETVFGVHMTDGCSGDQYIMDRIDFADVKSTAHLPYEVLVSGNAVYALPADFRIAISFPDLSMVGKNSFFSIMCAPDAVKEALGRMVRHKTKEKDSSW